MALTALPDLPDRLETDRLLIRCPQVGDGRQVHEAVVASLIALREFRASLPWAMERPLNAPVCGVCFVIAAVVAFGLHPRRRLSAAAHPLTCRPHAD